MTKTKICVAIILGVIWSGILVSLVEIMDSHHLMEISMIDKNYTVTTDTEYAEGTYNLMHTASGEIGLSTIDTDHVSNSYAIGNKITIATDNTFVAQGCDVAELYRTSTRVFTLVCPMNNL